MEARTRIPLRFALVLAAGVLALWLLRRALAPFFLAMVLAYLLAPIVEALAARIGRRGSVATVLVGSVAGVAGVVAAVAPWAGGQLQTLLASLPRWKAALVLASGIHYFLRASHAPRS